MESTSLSASVVTSLRSVSAVLAETFINFNMRIPLTNHLLRVIEATGSHSISECLDENLTHPAASVSRWSIERAASIVVDGDCIFLLSASMRS
jgi:hypothetical protein